MASAAHAYQATLTSQDSRGTKKAIPKTSPMRNEARSPRRCSAITSRAGPAAASGQNPTGGKAPTRATPPATAASRAQGSRSPSRRNPARPAGTPPVTGGTRPAVATPPVPPSGIRCMGRA